MKNLELQYMNKLEQQMVVAVGLRAANRSTDRWLQKMYRERMDKINAECVKLCSAVNDRRTGGRI